MDAQADLSLHCVQRHTVRFVMITHKYFSYLSCVMRKPAFCYYVKTKVQINYMVTAQLISAFVFATYLVQSLGFLNLKFQASNHLLWLYSWSETLKTGFLIKWPSGLPHFFIYFALQGTKSYHLCRNFSFFR